MVLWVVKCYQLHQPLALRSDRHEHPTQARSLLVVARALKTQMLGRSYLQRLGNKCGKTSLFKKRCVSIRNSNIDRRATLVSNSPAVAGAASSTTEELWTLDMGNPMDIRKFFRLNAAQFPGDGADAVKAGPGAAGEMVGSSGSGRSRGAGSTGASSSLGASVILDELHKPDTTEIPRRDQPIVPSSDSGRDDLARATYEEFNRAVFGGQLPSCRLRRTVQSAREAVNEYSKVVLAWYGKAHVTRTELFSSAGAARERRCIILLPRLALTGVNRLKHAMLRAMCTTAGWLLDGGNSFAG